MFAACVQHPYWRRKLLDNPDDHADWPDRFVYVCATGYGATVNVSPMLHAGSDRIVGLVVLEAVANRENPTTSEQVNAIQPSNRLQDYARNVLGLSQEDIHVDQRHPDFLTVWKDALVKAADMARARDAEVVLNITGGRKTATVGGILGYPRAPGIPKMWMISVGVEPFAVRLVEITDNGDLRERLLPAEDRLDLPTYLESYGVREVNTKARRRYQGWMRQQRGAVEVIRGMLADRSAKRLFRPLYSELYRQSEGSAEVSLDPKIADIARPLVQSLEGCQLNGGTLRVETEEAFRFLNGAWLEAALLIAVEDAAGGKSGVEIASNVELAGLFDRGAVMKQGVPTKAASQTDLDLVILGNDRLDVVQAKANVNVSRLHDGLDKLSKYRNQLAGQGGRAWLVAPLIDDAQLKKSNHRAHAVHEGVKLVSGPQAIDRFIASIVHDFRLS